MDNIEKIVYGFLESLANQKPLALKIKTVKGWNDCKVSNGVLSQKETVLKMKTVSFVNKGSEKYFTVLVHLLCEIYKLLERNTTCTKRELYYRNVELLNNQEVVNKAIDQICIILNVLPWELGILSSSKGLIAGKLMIEMDNETIDCSTISSVPANPSQIQQLVSNAEYILIVEKDTVFQRLVNDPLFAKVLEKTVIMTAKGYPDINTRLLLKKISVDLQIPIYILVDADPHGVDIMCTYKYGSLHLVHLSEQLAVPKIEWIGIHPSDIDALDVTHVNLTPGDLKMVDEMLERPYVDAILRRELNNFKTRQLKAEIESIYHFSINYLIDDYIPRKIRAIATPIMQLSQENHLLDD